jgi:hypothetical protein
MILFHGASIVHNLSQSSQIGHFDWLRLGFADAAPHSICHHKGFVYLLGSDKYRDDVVHFFDVVLANHTPTEPANGLC